MKTHRAIFKILKYALFITPAMILLVIILRVLASGGPSESRSILNNYNFESIYQDLGADFIIYKINVRNPFALGDTFCVTDVLYFESSGDLQLSFRGKKNRFEQVRDYLNISSENYDGLFKLYLRVTTRIITDIPGEILEETLVSEIIEPSGKYLFEDDRYEYTRVNFSGVHADYRHTKLELFALDISREHDLADLDNAEYMARITLLDINMPKSRAKIERFNILK